MSNPKRPETVELMLKVWLAALAVEFIHQIVSIALSLSNRETLFAAARTTAKDSEQPVPDALIPWAAYGTVAISALLSFVIIGVLAWMLHLLAKKSKHAGTGRRIWFAFSVYFLFRVLFIFLASPAGSDSPDWLFLLDGALQILVGVAAAMGIAFCLKRETLDYTGELEQLRRMERELEQARREKQEEEKRKAREEGQAGDAKPSGMFGRGRPGRRQGTERKSSEARGGSGRAVPTRKDHPAGSDEPEKPTDPANAETTTFSAVKPKTRKPDSAPDSADTNERGREHSSDA